MMIGIVRNEVHKKEMSDEELDLLEDNTNLETAQSISEDLIRVSVSDGSTLEETNEKKRKGEPLVSKLAKKKYEEVSLLKKFIPLIEGQEKKDLPEAIPSKVTLVTDAILVPVICLGYFGTLDNRFLLAESIPITKIGSLYKNKKVDCNDSAELWALEKGFKGLSNLEGSWIRDTGEWLIHLPFLVVRSDNLRVRKLMVAFSKSKDDVDHLLNSEVIEYVRQMKKSSSNRPFLQNCLDRRELEGEMINSMEECKFLLRDRSPRFEFLLIPGKENVNADYLSRLIPKEKKRWTQYRPFMADTGLYIPGIYAP